MKKILGLGILTLTLGIFSAPLNAVNYQEVKGESVSVESVSSTIVEDIDTPATNEEDNFLNKIEQVFDEIKNYQVAGTTIGAITGTTIGALISAIPAILNRKNIKKAIQEVDNSKIVIDDTKKLAESIQKMFDINSADYAKVIEYLDSLSQVLNCTQLKLGEVLKDNKSIKQGNTELLDVLLTSINNNKELVSSGVAEKLNKKYLTKTTSALKKEKTKNE